MAFDLSSPVAKLAFEMALRNRQTIDQGGQFDAQARAAVSKALATGNDTLAPFEDIYRQYVDPAEASRRAQAEAFNAYLVGLPELLSKSADEQAASRGAGTSSALLDTTNLSNYETPAQKLSRILGAVLPARRTPVAAQQYRTSVTRSGMGSGRPITARRL